MSHIGKYVLDGRSKWSGNERRCCSKTELEGLNSNTDKTDNTEVKYPVANGKIKTLLGKSVPLLEYTLEGVETEEVKQTLLRVLQKGVLNPEAIIMEASEGMY